MTARTYTAEAIEALVRAASEAGDWLASFIGGPDSALTEALRPFVTEPSSWQAYLRERWGDHWGVDGHQPTPAEWVEARASYRIRYGVEP